MLSHVNNGEDEEKINFRSKPVQCLAGYYHMICGHILDENYKWGVLVNTCKEFGLYHPHKGDHLIRASLPPS